MHTREDIEKLRTAGDCEKCDALADIGVDLLHRVQIAEAHEQAVIDENTSLKNGEAYQAWCREKRPLVAKVKALEQILAAFVDLAPEISAFVDKDTMAVYDELCEQAHKAGVRGLRKVGDGS